MLPCTACIFGILPPLVPLLVVLVIERVRTLFFVDFTGVVIENVGDGLLLKTLVNCLWCFFLLRSNANEVTR
jgi:hypothetical protein